MDSQFTVRELRRGRRPGDRFVRVVRAQSPRRGTRAALRVASQIKGLVVRLPAGRRS